MRASYPIEELIIDDDCQSQTFSTDFKKEKGSQFDSIFLYLFMSELSNGVTDFIDSFFI